MNQNNIIGRTVLEIEIDRLDDAWSFQAEISDIFQQQGVPAMEQLFDRLVGADRVIRLDRVVVDLPPIDRHFLADEFVRNLLAALDLALTDRLAELLPRDPAETKIQTQAAADWEVLLYFLQYGRLPWWCPTADWQTWLPRWEAVMQTETEWQYPLRALLKNNTAAQLRLITQFAPGFRHQLILQLQPTWLGWSNLRSQAQQLMHALGLSLSTVDRLEAQAWLRLFAELVEGTAELRPLPTIDWIRAWLKDLYQTWRSSVNTQPPTTLAPDTEGEIGSIDRRVTPQTLFSQRLRMLLAELPITDRSSWLAALDSLTSLSPDRLPDRPDRIATSVLPSIDTTLDTLSQSEPPFPANVQTNPIDLSQGSIDLQLSPEEIAAGLFVDRAGLILLHPFLSPYFAELGLLDGEVFRDETAQQTAIYLLHYLATGQTDAPESELVIPKLLCGWHLNQPMLRGIELPAAALLEGENLLQTAIDYWQVLKDTSPDGLREGFLQRTGKLTHQEDGNWRLQVEQQSIDILLGSLPWGINVVTLPWLEYLIMVEWS